MPDEFFDGAAKRDLLRAIDESLALQPECDELLGWSPGTPLLLADWVQAQWCRHGDSLAGWLSFLRGLGLRAATWVNLGTDSKALGLFLRRPDLAALAKGHEDTLARALEDAHHVSCGLGSLDGPQVTDPPVLARAFKRMVELLRAPELGAADLRPVDRRVLLSSVEATYAGLVALLRTRFWQGLAEDDIARWLQLRGTSCLLFGSASHRDEYLLGYQIPQLWLRVAASARSEAHKQRLFATALEIAFHHWSVGSEDVRGGGESRRRFREDAAVELAAAASIRPPQRSR